MRGNKESLNVSVATGIVLYRLLDRWKTQNYTGGAPAAPPLCSFVFLVIHSFISTLPWIYFLYSLYYEGRVE
jgi:hypothetical protein